MTLTTNRHDNGALEIVTKEVARLTESAPAQRPNGKGSAATSPTHIAAPVEALRTLAARLQLQLDGHEADGAPEARALRGSVRRRLNQVNAALERIDQGKYGVCADCDKPIENDRLLLQPAATRCINCQTVAEWHGIE
jgi:hypothetical protein